MERIAKILNNGTLQLKLVFALFISFRCMYDFCHINFYIFYVFFFPCGKETKINFYFCEFNQI